MGYPTAKPFSQQELKSRQCPRPLDLAPPASPFRPYSPPPVPEPDLKSHSHSRKFDQGTYNKITGLDARLLEQINFDCKARAKLSKTGARYSTKSEEYYAKILGVCRETISHHVQKLAKLGILDITRRRKVRGNWQTNLYRIVSWSWWRVGALLRSLKKQPNHVTQPPHKADPRREIKTPKEEKGGAGAQFTQEILARWASKGYPLDPLPT